MPERLAFLIPVLVREIRKTFIPAVGWPNWIDHFIEIFFYRHPRIALTLNFWILLL